MSEPVRDADLAEYPDAEDAVGTICPESGEPTVMQHDGEHRHRTITGREAGLWYVRYRCYKCGATTVGHPVTGAYS